MSVIEAIILGVVQGLTEFLPVSSSGHLAIGQHLLGSNPPGLEFEIMVHFATVLSTIVIFRKEILGLLKGLTLFKYNIETKYLLNIVISMIPVLIVGLFFKDFVEGIFGTGLLVVGVSLIITSILLYLTTIIKPREKEINGPRAFIIGLAQAIAVLPGLSRSGATISTGLLLGIKKSDIARFSFLMVLVPILGEAFLSIVKGEMSGSADISVISLAAGFVAAFVSGLLACKVMIEIVKRFKLTWFAIYCALLGVVTLFIA